MINLFLCSPDHCGCASLTDESPLRARCRILSSEGEPKRAFGRALFHRVGLLAGIRLFPHFTGVQLLEMHLRMLYHAFTAGRALFKAHLFVFCGGKLTRTSLELHFHFETSSLASRKKGVKMFGSSINFKLS